MNAQPEPARLFRSSSDRMVSGVCGGIAEYFGWDSSLVRLAFIFIVLVGGSGILVYIILWFILPPQNTPMSSADSLPSSRPSGGSVGGILLIILGVLVLTQNFGFNHYLQFGKVWPILIIFFGFHLLTKR